MVATCSAQDIRLWNARKGQELLRITVPNMVCNAIAIMEDGKSIVSGNALQRASSARHQFIDALEFSGNYSATSNNMKLVHWPLMGGLLHLVQRGGG